MLNKKIKSLEKIRKWMVSLSKCDFSICGEYIDLNSYSGRNRIVPREKGLCFHLLLMLTAVQDDSENFKMIDGGFPEEVEKLEDGFYDEVLEYWFKNYSLHTKRKYFPVPSPCSSMTVVVAYEQLDKWEGEYGQSRILLVECTINFIDEKLKQLKGSENE